MEFERRRLGVLAPGRETLCYSPHRLFLILCVRGVKIECEQHVAESLADEMAANRHGGLATAGEQRWRPLRRAGRAQRISGLVCDGEVLPWAFVLAVDPWLFRRPSGVTAVIGPWSEVEPPICSAALTHQEGGISVCYSTPLPSSFPSGRGAALMSLYLCDKESNYSRTTDRRISDRQKRSSGRLSLRIECVCTTARAISM